MLWSKILFFSHPYNTLQGRMIIIPAFSLMGAFLIIFLIGSYYQYRVMDKNLHTRYQSVSMEIGKGLENALLQNDLGLVEDILERYAALESIKKVSLINDQKDLVIGVHYVNQSLSKSYSDQKIDFVAKDKNGFAEEDFHNIIFASPIEYDNSIWWVRIEVSKQEIFSALTQFALIWFSMMVLFLGLLILIIVKLLKKPVNDIKKLASYTQKLSQKYGLDLDVESDIKEIYDLSMNLNFLSQTLYQHDEQLKIQHDQLKELNMHLKSNVEKEVQKNRQKDLILLKQSRMAAIGEMLNHIAHQWRQPLNTVAIEIQNLALSEQLAILRPGEITQTVESAMEQINYLSETINNFRNIMKPTVHRDTFSIAKSIQNALSLTSATYKYAQIQVKEELDGSLFLDHGTKENLTQVLVILLNNTKDAFETNGIAFNRHVSVTMIHQPAEHSVIIKLCDNAGGINPEIIEKIFDPYFTTKHESVGTGLGLYIAKKIISDDFLGNIDVTSEEDESCFIITLVDIEKNESEKRV